MRYFYLLYIVSVTSASEISEAKSPPTKLPDVQKKMIDLIDIESNDYIHQNILYKSTNKLFFTETSGKPYLTPRYACAIESAIKNTGLSGDIIVVMTASFLDINANNATYHLYTKHSEKSIFFRKVNLDTIFSGTPISRLHINGHLRHHDGVHTAVQYRSETSN